VRGFATLKEREKLDKEMKRRWKIIEMQDR
jgi:hypothetical protein